MTDALTALRGLPFVKMTGSGNDFVFFDGRDVPSSLVTAPDAIRAICNRHNGIGADGLVVLEPANTDGDARILYFNSDGSPADLCGNATLCSTRLASTIGLAEGGGMTLVTPAGAIRARLGPELPEIDLLPVQGIQATMDIPLGPGERRIGFAVAGIPHLVILCDDAEAIDVMGRGPGLRSHPALGAAGANVNWVSPGAAATWRYRTFERGVEGETLACGTGAVATAVLLDTWALATAPVVIRTSSGRDLTIRRRPENSPAPAISSATMAGSKVAPGGEVGDSLAPSSEASWLPSLAGEGRIVFEGRIGELG